MANGSLRQVVLLLSMSAASCASFRPEDAAPVAALRVDPAAAANFPGAKSIADGVDCSGERALREGDRIALGVEVVLGEAVERHLLEVIVHRRRLGEDAGIVRFHATDPSTADAVQVPDRHTRRLDLELVLRTPDGVERRRSWLDGVPEFVLDESFVPAIHRGQAEDPRTHGVAVLRLVQIAQMLQDDPILQDLLRQAASVPWDITLLWRRELLLTPYFEQGRATTPGAATYEVPFDLFLNDSLLVRLVATVMDPRGPSGAIGGIVNLRAQDARHPEHQLHVHLLGAARGPASDWQRDGVLAAYGYADEGTGLAFSPDGRFVAMPGAGHDVVLHDLTAADPGVASSIVCVGRTRDLAFLDDDTLLVATDHHVQVIDVAADAAPRLLATHEVADAQLCAIEAVDADTAFVGGHGFAIERWRFAADRSEAPQREQVQAVQREAWTGRSANDDGTVVPMSGTLTRIPPTGWLLGVDADRVLARSENEEIEWRRAADGTWTQDALERVAQPASRRQRRSDAPIGNLFERVTKGTPMVRSEAAKTHAFSAGPVSLTGATGTRILHNMDSCDDYCHGFSPDGRHYAFVAPGYRLLVDTARFLAAVR